MLELVLLYSVRRYDLPTAVSVQCIAENVSQLLGVNLSRRLLLSEFKKAEFRHKTIESALFKEWEAKTRIHRPVPILLSRQQYRQELQRELFVT